MVSAATEAVLPRVLLSTWQRLRSYGGAAVFRSSGGLTVMVQVEEHHDGQWLHVSTSRRSKLPSWDDLKHVKAVFVGRGRRAIQIIPDEAEYVNICTTCLHMWSKLGEQHESDDWRATELMAAVK